jgi:UDP-3-O-[3-hydroxymyristoyl] glucosamine N-acyltransferase
MAEPIFFRVARALGLDDILELTGARLHSAGSFEGRISGIAALNRAGPTDIAFLENVQYVSELATTGAGVCLLPARFAEGAPERVAVLCSEQPYRDFVAVARALFPEALRPSSLFEAGEIVAGASVHASARLENGVRIDPGAVIGPRAEVGAGTSVGPGAVLGPGVRVGRDCSIGAGATLTHALVGDRVIIHPGCHIGQDGFGFVVGPKGHIKVPQVGRVIVQDDVEIGAGTTVDRGANRDTVIGEGTKIDNLVQIAHNVTIGRHCVIVAQAGIAGSATIQDFVVLGARVGVNSHVTIGESAQIAATSIVHGDVPGGARWGGTPAKPARIWMRELKMLEMLARKGAAGTKAGGRSDDD